MPRRADIAAAATWDRHAARYAAQERWEVAAIDVALRVAAPRADERLVDLGTGTALVLRRLAAMPGPGPREALGVDRSPAMLARAGTLPAGWSTLEADARAVPRPGGWAGVATCAYVLHLLAAEERAAVLAEARRLLAPGPSSRLVVVSLWSDRRLVRAALRLLARCGPPACAALRPYDPACDLARTGWVATQRVRLPRGGYPSLVVVAKRAPAS